jgi:hypothetical protein
LRNLIWFISTNKTAEKMEEFMFAPSMASQERSGLGKFTNERTVRVSINPK